MNRDRLVSLLGLAGFIVMADNWVVSPILPAISGSLGIDVARAGLLITAYMIPFGVFQLLFGPLAATLALSFVLVRDGTDVPTTAMKPE